MRSKRRIGFGVLVCGGVIAALSDVSWQSAQAQDSPEIRTLSLMGSFKIPTNPALRLRVVRSSGISLWFLMSGPNYTEAVQTNSTGLKQMSFAPPSPMSSSINTICVSEAGRFAGVHSNGQIDVFSNAVSLRSRTARILSWN